jgi:cephalosporin-C deacetylase-like acetyl esterase
MNIEKKRFKKHLIPFCIACIISCGMHAQYKTKQATFDDKWRFRPGDDTAWAFEKVDEQAWTDVSTKKGLEEQGFPQFNGYGWYRRSVSIPDSLRAAIQKGGGAVITYGQVDDCDALYFNGHFIGQTGGFPPDYESKYGVQREYVVPATYVRFGKPNIVAVRVYDGGGGGGIISQDLAVRNLTPLDLVRMNVEVPDTDKIFLAPQSHSLSVTVTNNNKTPIAATLHIDITTDDFKPLKSIKQPLTLKPAATVNKPVRFTPPAPGFYRYSVYLSMKGGHGKMKKFNLGYEPEKIAATPDAPNDFNAFWQEGLNALAAVAPDYQLTPLPQASNNDYEVFEVSMQSFGNEPIKGYYAKPKRAGTFPVTVEYQGYSEGPRLPSLTWDGFAHMLVSIRGQGQNKEGHRYGDWIVYGLENKEGYYYRGAYLDVVRGIDFVSTRPEIDTTKIVTMGGSQGGALTFAAAALDKRVKACAPTIPFLSDYRKYFRIVPWPRSSFESYRKEHPDVSWEHIYNVLSYFDIKNLAPRITAPLFMGIGVQDEVCPPHINFAAFNNVKAPKRWIAYADMGHGTGPDFEQKRLQFFKEQLGIE